MFEFMRKTRYVVVALLFGILQSSCESGTDTPSSSSVAAVAKNNQGSGKERPIRETVTTAAELAKYDSPLSRHNIRTCTVEGLRLTTWTSADTSEHCCYNGVFISLRLSAPQWTKEPKLVAKAEIDLMKIQTGVEVRRCVRGFEFTAKQRPESNFEAQLEDVFNSNMLDIDKRPDVKRLELGKHRISIKITLDDGTKFVMPEFEIDVGNGEPFANSRIKGGQ